MVQVGPSSCRPPFSPLSQRSASRLLGGGSGNVGGRLAAAASDHALQQQLMARHQADVCGGSPIIPSVSIVHAEPADESPPPSDSAFEPQPSTSKARPAPKRSLSGDKEGGRPPRALKCRSKSCGAAPPADAADVAAAPPTDDAVVPSAASAEAIMGDDSIPPPPPPPQCLSRKNQNRDGKPAALSRLSRDELVALWRSSESELRELLLSAIRDKDEVQVHKDEVLKDKDEEVADPP